MELLGNWNWYLPSWLVWLPRLHVEGPGHGEQRPEGASAYAGGS
jgi:RND superfamily putative drug exporter